MNYLDSAEPKFVQANNEVKMQLPAQYLNEKFSSYELVKKYELTNTSSTEISRLADGTYLQLNDEGRIIQIEYPSGATIRRHDYYVMVRGSDSVNWFGDDKTWYQWD